MHTPYYFSHARTALKYGLQYLGIKRDDYILLPDYLCDVLLHPLNQLEIKYKYYSIKDDLTPNWLELENLVKKKTKAILMVHYFGQPQDIKRFQDFCKAHNLKLIEDNAHGHGGMYNGQLLGTFSDMGISSPRKTLNTYSGGILWLTGEKLYKDPDLSSYSIPIYNQLKKPIFDYFPLLKYTIKKVLNNRPKFEDPTAFMESHITDNSIDKCSRKTIEKTDWEELRKNRQLSYHKWENFALENSLVQVYSKLNPEANPWCFPAYAINREDAINWFEWGWKNNYNVFSWPSLPEKIITDNPTLERWKRLVCFSTEHNYQK